MADLGALDGVEPALDSGDVDEGDSVLIPCARVDLVHLRLLVGVLVVKLVPLGLEGGLVRRRLAFAELAAEPLDFGLGACGLALALVEVDLLLATELEPQRRGVDDDEARVFPPLGEALGVPDEKAQLLGAPPRHDVLEPVRGGPGQLGLALGEGLVLLLGEALAFVA